MLRTVMCIDYGTVKLWPAFRSLQALPYEYTLRDALEMRDRTWDALNARTTPAEVAAAMFPENWR